VYEKSTVQTLRLTLADNDLVSLAYVKTGYSIPRRVNARHIIVLDERIIEAIRIPCCHTARSNVFK